MPTAPLRSAMAAEIAAATHMSLHVSDPGDTGAGEIAGGTPPYARVAISSWAPGATPGTYVATLAGPFNVPPATDIAYAGLWNGNTFLEKAQTSAATIGQEVVTISQVVFVVG